MHTDFPKPSSQFLKAVDFQDTTLTMTFKGWDKKTNKDDSPEDRKQPKTWKQKLKYQLRYTYPEYATDEAGEKLLDKNGNPFVNKNWDPEHPNGYTIVYHFDEGELECGSLPLFDAFCRIRPGVGERISINRTGEGTDTKWKVKRISDGVPDIQVNDLSNDPLEKTFQGSGDEEVVPF